MREGDVVARLRRMATAPEARGLLDDVALVGDLVISHDSIAENVHYLPSDPPASVGWKLVAVNLSDLAAKGASPRAALLSLTLSGDTAWEDAFLGGIEAACEHYGLALIGGDTIALPPGTPRVLGMTVIGTAGSHVPDRAGGRAGDLVWLVGTLGDAAAGLAQLRASRTATGPLVDLFRRPIPQLGAGSAIAPMAHAMMDVSDGLLLDARRMAEASGCTVRIDLDRLPLSAAFIEARGDALAGRMFAATAGDDYALLAALPAELDPYTLCLPQETRLTAIGELAAGAGVVSALSGGRPIELPERLGFEHSSHDHRQFPAPPVADRA